MALLLDTHAVAWWFLGDPQLSPPVRRLIEQNDGPTFVSVVSAFEMAQKLRLGKWPDILPLVEGFEQLLALANMTALPVSLRHAIRAGSYPADHRDPFDRMLAAQAEVEGLRLVSADERLAAFGIEVVWG